MKQRWWLWVVILMIGTLTCLGCVSKADAPGSELSSRCAEALASVARTSGATPTVRANRLSLGQDELLIVARIESERELPPKYAIGLAVDVAVNGAAPLTAGSVGIGTDRDDALNTALSEWAGLAGIAWLGALGVQAQGEPGFETAGFSVHCGLTGIRGAIPAPWSEESQRQLAGSLDGLIRQLDLSPSEFHSISLMIVVKRDAQTQGECRVDGAVSAEALKAVRTFPWPASKEEYIFKQFYVLRRLKPTTPTSEPGTTR